MAASPKVALGTVRRRCVVRVPHFEPRPTADGYGTVSVKTHETDEEIEVEVDFDSLVRQYGIRACRNKSGRSTLKAGAVVVRKVKP